MTNYVKQYVDRKTSVTYVEDIRKAAHTERDQYISKREEEANDKIMHLKGKDILDNLFVFVLYRLGNLVWIIFAVLVLLDFLFKIETPVPVFIISYLVCWIALRILVTVVFKSSKSGAIDRERTACSKDCARARKEAQELVDSIQKKYEADYMKHLERLGGQADLLVPVAEWASEYLEKNVRSANRAMDSAKITAQLRLTVRSNEVVLYTRGGSRLAAAKFSEGVGGTRYANLSEAPEQEAFAHVVGKLMAAQIMAKFPEDPVAPMPGVTPTVTVERGACSATVVYSVENPNFRAVVRL